MECRITPSLGVVIVAGGKGHRMGGSIPKQFMLLGQKPILAHTINAFAEAFTSAEIVVTLPAEYIDYWHNLSSRFNVATHKCIIGGEERFHSVHLGIKALSPDVEIIAVHDGVRPLVSHELLNRCFEQTIKLGSAVPAIEVSDSFRMVKGKESQIIERGNLRAIQTPQMFDSAILRRAYRQEFSTQFTDDASVVESSGERIELCQGERSNIKITTSEDILYAQTILNDNAKPQDIQI